MRPRAPARAPCPPHRRCRSHRGWRGRVPELPRTTRGRAPASTRRRPGRHPREGVGHGSGHTRLGQFVEPAEQFDDRRVGARSAAVHGSSRLVGPSGQRRRPRGGRRSARRLRRCDRGRSRRGHRPARAPRRRRSRARPLGEHLRGRRSTDPDDDVGEVPRRTDRCAGAHPRWRSTREIAQPGGRVGDDGHPVRSGKRRHVLALHPVRPPTRITPRLGRRAGRHPIARRPETPRRCGALSTARGVRRRRRAAARGTRGSAAPGPAPRASRHRRQLAPQRPLGIIGHARVADHTTWRPYRST